MSFAFIFPGQGVSQVGMGLDIIKQYPEKKVFLEKIDSLLNEEISKICFSGPYEKLIDARISGLAVFLVSALINEILMDLKIEPKAFAGYSVGQYSALYSAFVFSLEDALFLLNERGRLMKEATSLNASSMLSVIGLSIEKVKEIISNFNNCYMANYNSPGNISISYKKEIRSALIDELNNANAMSVVELDVAAGWHSPFLENAADAFLPFLEKVNFNNPGGLYVDNYTAELEGDPQIIKKNLYYHLFNAVKWHQSIKKLIDNGIDTFIEVGYGNQLKKFVKFINRKVKVYSTGTVAELLEVIEILNKKNVTI